MKTKSQQHFMIDIETTGTVRGKDKILQIAAVPLEQDKQGFFRPELIKATDEEIDKMSLSQLLKGNHIWKKREVFNRNVYYSGKPETIFAKEHMVGLYEECNKLDAFKDSIESVIEDFRTYLHGTAARPPKSANCCFEPKRVMGWNASNFDCEFLFDYGMTRSHYIEMESKEVLVGDMHYQVYEIGGLLAGMVSITGLDHKLVKELALAACPEHVKLEVKGTAHDGLDDCYYQVNLLNGLIALGRSGITKSKLQGDS